MRVSRDIGRRLFAFFSACVQAVASEVADASTEVGRTVSGEEEDAANSSLLSQEDR